MFLTRIITSLILLFCVLFPRNANAQSCLNASANSTDTICLGNCAILACSVIGTQNSSTYSMSPTPYAPYPFTGGNPVIVNLDDVWSPVINIPFCFEFYGTVYNQLVIGTNGLITFDLTQANSVCPWTINTAAPNPALPMNSIMAPYHDINPMLPTDSAATSINWQVYGVSPCRVMVINWNDVAMFGVGCDTMVSTSQVVLHETTHLIDIFIREKHFCNSWNNGAAIEGLHNATGTQATIIPGRNYPSNWAASNDGVRFRPSGTPSFTVQWFDFSNNLIGTGSSISVCPTQNTSYTTVMVNTSCNGNPVTIIDTVSVIVVQSNLSALDTIIQPTCNNNCDGAIDIYAINGFPSYVYTWTPASLGNGPSVSGLCPGNYACVVSDSLGCDVSLIFNLSAPPPFSLSGSSTPTGCNSSIGTASVFVTGGTGPFTYLWNTGDTSSSISNLAAGTYLVVVNDSLGCPDSIYVNVPSNGLSLSTTQTALLCNGDCNASATVTPQSGTAPYTYSWAPYGGTGPTANGFCSGVFFCTVTDATGCTSMAGVTISSPAPMIVVPSSNITICMGQSTMLTVSVSGGTPPYTYAWNNNLPPNANNSVSPVQTTVYTVVVTDANGCVSAQQSTQVKVNITPIPNFGSTEATCPPSEIFFTNLTDSALTYLWNFGDPASGTADTSSLYAPSHVYGSGGNYTVTLIATNIYGCIDTISIPAAVIVPSAPAVSLTASSQLLTILDPTTTFYNSSSGGIVYQIYFGDGDSLYTSSSGPYEHSYDSLGTYIVMLIAWDQQGCSDTAWLTLVIEEPSSLYIPNAFTPNGNGNNDIFMVSALNIDEFELLIFDRWGMLIFSSYDTNNGWDGTFKGDKCQEDVYVWRLKYVDNLGNRYNKIGHVSLIR